MNKKIIISVIVLILILLSVPLAVYLVQQRQEIRKMAAPATVLSLIPASAEKNPDEEFSLSVTINTGENQVAAADVTLVFDSSKLVAISVTQGSFLASKATDPTISTGSVRFVYYNQPAKQGEGTLATVNFKVQKDTTPETSAGITFSPATMVGGVDEKGDVLAKTNPATITILGADCKTLWWYDNDHRYCQQKEFCGLYMYEGLRTFSTKEECEADLTPPGAGCREPCSNDSDCQSGLKCGTPCPPGQYCAQVLICYNPDCPLETDCVCPPSTPSPSPSPGTGGTTASPTPSPSPTVSPEDLPETGIITPTLFFLTSGGVLFLLAFLLI